MVKNQCVLDSSWETINPLIHAPKVFVFRTRLWIYIDEHVLTTAEFKDPAMEALTMTQYDVTLKTFLNNLKFIQWYELYIKTNISM